MIVGAEVEARAGNIQGAGVEVGTEEVEEAEMEEGGKHIRATGQPGYREGCFARRPWYHDACPVDTRSFVQPVGLSL